MSPGSSPVRLGWRRLPAAMIGSLLLPGAAIAAGGDEPPRQTSYTSRMVVERQFAAPPRRPNEISGTEASRIRELQLQRMGQMLRPVRETSGGRTGS